MCEGKRVVFGYGGMKHECKTCKGTGKQAKAAKELPKVDKRTKQYRDDNKEA